MQKIYKYPFPIQDDFTLLLPKDTTILSVQVENQIPCMWVSCNPDNDTEICHFIILPTGGSYDNENYGYLATIQNYAYVWHIFKRKSYDTTNDKSN